jgi:TRAP-type C4-dicarboxylate transport system permease small subunit
VRILLDRVYKGAGYLAGAFIVLIVLMILAQIIGRWIGVIVPSTEDFAGYFLAASSFLALAYTFKQGGHIRVTLLVRHLNGRASKLFLLFALAILALIIGYGAYYASALVIESWQFGEMSQGYIAIPIWIPQTSMAAGLIVFFVALVDELVLVLQGGNPAFLEHEN